MTEVGVVGGVKDHFTVTAPIFGRFSRPESVTDQMAGIGRETDRLPVVLTGFEPGLADPSALSSRPAPWPLYP